MSEQIEGIELDEDGRPLSPNALQQRRRETRAAERQERIEGDSRFRLLCAIMRHAMRFSPREIAEWMGVRQMAVVDAQESNLERDLDALMQHYPLGIAITAVRNNVQPQAA